MILEKVEDPEDALNVLKASRKLEERFQWKKPLWLLGQVLEVPRFVEFVVDLFHQKNLLTLRKVSKLWRQAVDTHLQEMRSLRPWHYDDPCPSKLEEWTCTQDVEYFEDDDEFYWYGIGDVLLLNVEDAQKFLDENKSLSPEANPFPAKSVCLNISDFEGLQEEDLEEINWGLVNLNAHQKFTKWLECMRKLFDKFGCHIHTLKLKFTLIFNICPCSPMIFCNMLMELLSLLPNLKEIVYVAHNEDRTLQDRYLVEPGLKFPLESLTLTGSKDPISTALLSRYGHLLRKLVVTQFAIRLIQQQANCFLQLRELVIINVFGVGDLAEDLKDCSFPQLVKLTLPWKWNGNPVEKIIPLLTMFPTIKYLDTDPDQDCTDFYEEQNLSLDIKPLPNLEFIIIPFSPRLSYKFLLNFPDLKEIKFIAEFPGIWSYQDDVNESVIFPELHEKIRTEKLHESNIWSVFPKLQVVNLEWVHYYGYRDGKVVDFHRFDYNRHQQLLRESEGNRKLLDAEGEIEAGTMPAETEDLLKQYEALECAGCDEVIGYRDRTSGKIYCCGGHPFGCFLLD